MASWPLAFDQGLCRRYDQACDEQGQARRHGDSLPPVDGHNEADRNQHIALAEELDGMGCVPEEKRNGILTVDAKEPA